MAYREMIFDFDGTIADSFSSFLAVWNRIATECRFRVVAPEEIEFFRDKKSQDVVRALDIPLPKLPFVLQRVRKEFRRMMAEIPLVPGIKETLVRLRAQGIQLGLLSSNASENVQAFLELNEVECFDFFSTSSGLWGKARRIEKMLRTYGLDRNQVLYIGDESRDIEAARKAGVQVAAVTWGYNNTEVLERFSPDHLINQPDELLALMRL